MLHRYNKEWSMRFALGGRAALEMLKESPVDVLVTDMKIPEMSGVELMEAVKREYPGTIRIVLSGHSEREDVIRAASLAHQYLAKPTKSEKLIEVISQTYLVNSILKDAEVKRVITNIDVLPTLPETYRRVEEELNSEDFSLKRVGEIVAKDMAMSTSILKQVNSAFWGLSNKITSPEQAVNLLGAEVIRALLLSATVFLAFEETDPQLISMESIEKKSQLAGRFSKIIAKIRGCDKATTESIFIAALLQDVGQLILMTSFPESYKVVIDAYEANRKFKPDYYKIRDAEAAVMGVTHAEIGAYLLGTKQ